MSVTDHLILPVKHLMQKPVNKRVSPVLILMHSVMCEISPWQGSGGNRALLFVFLALSSSFLNFLILYGPRNAKNDSTPLPDQKNLFISYSKKLKVGVYKKHHLKDPLAQPITLHTLQPSPVRRNNS